MKDKLKTISIKNKIILLVISIFLLLSFSLLLSYAYFELANNNGTRTIIDIETAYSRLEISTSEPLDLTLDKNNFSKNSGSYITGIDTKITLAPTVDGKKDYVNYNVYLNISKNDFKYTTVTNEVEILMTIVDKDGNYIKNIDGYNYVTLTSDFKNEDGELEEKVISGFDITEEKGAIQLGKNIGIESQDELFSHEWIVLFTFVNLNTNQYENTLKGFNADIFIDFPGEEQYIKDMIINDNYGENYINNKKVSSIYKMPISSDNYYDVDNSVYGFLLQNVGMPVSIAFTDENGLYPIEDDFGTSYLFRGHVENNWVSFAGYYWRIVRINGDGSIRLIYAGTELEKEDLGTLIDLEELLFGSGSVPDPVWDYSKSIGITYFNEVVTSAEEMGYVYTTGQERGHETSSTIKTEVDKWYESNLLSYSEYLADSTFCLDRDSYYYDHNLDTLHEIPAVGADEVSFGSVNKYKYETLYESGFMPGQADDLSFFNLKCNNELDRLSVSNEVGNGGLKYPISLLTQKEALLISGAIIFNIDTYLYSNGPYYTLGGGDYNSSYQEQEFGYVVLGVGNIGDMMNPEEQIGIKPVINIKGDLLATGSGTDYDPYIIK